MGPQAVGASREFPRDAAHEDSVEPALEHRWLARPPRGVDENQRVAPLQRFSVLTDCGVSAIIEMRGPFGRTELRSEAIGVQVDQSSFGTRLVGISTYGSPRSAVRLINDNGRRTISRALRLSCGVRTRTQWLGLYSVDNSTKSERQDFAASVERTMASL